MVSPTNRVTELLGLLVCEETDTDAGDVLAELSEVAGLDHDTQIAFDSSVGYAAVLSFTTTHPRLVVSVLMAAGTSAESCCIMDVLSGEVVQHPKVSWPPLVAHRLASLAVDWEREPVAAEWALRLLAWACQDPCQRQIMLSPSPALGREGSVLAYLLHALESGLARAAEERGKDEGGGMSSSSDRAKHSNTAEGESHSYCLSLKSIWSVIRLISFFVPSDGSGASPITQAGHPFLLLLRLHAAIPHSAPGSAALPPQKAAAAASKASSTVSAALSSAHSVAAAAHRPPCCVTASAAVTCMLQLCSVNTSAGLRAELLTHTSAAKDGYATRATQAVPGPGLCLLLSEVQRIVKRCPTAVQQSVNNELEVTGYHKGRVAADACALLPGVSAKQSGREAADPQAAAFLQHSTLVLWLDLLAAVASNGRTLALGLYSLQITSLLQEIARDFSSSSPEVVQSVERVYGALAVNCQAVTDEIMLESNLHALLGITTCCNSIQSSSGRALLPCALSKLAQIVDTCSGADFLQLTRKHGALIEVARILESCDEQGAEMHDAARCLFLGCLERSRRVLGLQPSQAPRLGFFGTLKPRDLLQFEQHIRHSKAATRQQQPTSRPEREKAAPASSDSTGEHSSRSGVKKQGDQGSGVGSENNGAELHDDDGYDSDGVKMVWASGPPPHIHAARMRWQSIPLAERVRWDQSSDAIMLWLALPAGTTKQDLTVAIHASHLTVRLSWAGRVLDGPLARKIKASEALWVIETGKSAADTQLHIVLPKAERHYWRSVFEGGLEKSHIEVLRTAVDADETLPSYDDLDDKAKELVEDFRERQWMISQGHLSMENSMDDFRVVVGDNTL